ncbi:MAG: ABC transporter substrate-binding protein [Azospirillaceae bacterium]
MTFATKSLAVLGTVALASTSLVSSATAQDTIQVALGDIASIESLNLLIAMERAGERGVPMEMTFFNSEDVAVQAVASGEADIGVGAPYAFINNSDAPIRMFFRISTLLFFPVVNSEVYSDWADLDGEEVTVHSRGSGTEALMRLMESVHGIEYANISYVPGSEVRAGAMLQGTINASIVDAANYRLLQEEGGGRFIRLSVEGVNATDEALYANTDFLDERSEDMAIFVEELLRTWSDIDVDPSIVSGLREQYGLLPDLPGDAAEEIDAYYAEAVENGVYPLDGGEPQDAIDDIEFLRAAGTMEGEGEVDPSRFWDFTILDQVR